MSSEFKLPLPARLLRCTAARRPVPAFDDRLLDAHIATFAELEAGVALEPDVARETCELNNLELGNLALIVDELIEELEQRPAAELSISLILLDAEADARDGLARDGVAEVA